MTATAQHRATPEVKRNVALLATCQGLGTSTMSMMIAMGGLVGYWLAENKGLATLPVTTVVTGTALMTIPAAHLMGRVGRRAGFMMGTMLGVAGGFMACLALYLQSFWLFCAATGLVGMFSAFVQQYRHAAVDMAPIPFRPRAVSLVMAGGVVAGFLGPELVKWTKDMVIDLPGLGAIAIPYFGAYLGVVALCVISAVILSFLRIPRPVRRTRAEQGRPLSEIMKQPVFWVAAGSGMAGFGVMSLIMTATPLAMVGCGLADTQAFTVIQWHVVAMFAPSFFTGHLISRFGVLRIIAVGGVLNLICVATALSGLEFLHFWSALVLLGIGWNFMFVGGTTLLAECYEPEEAPRVQGLNDFLVFGMVAVSSLSSGQLLEFIGWNAVTLTAVPVIGLALAGVFWLMATRRGMRRA
ncbi:MFS transporter [Minwuia thermotolerans]|uniref:MFS transporter n=1 Tax=Minwuia thermotolerans TaxID=2056226 RepID=A0A2M9G1A8_9PROT|nr:MFS transporter [Minwuia thermotolerans]PJK29493.1 MFS transporter [Minwuia thermotolerans]